MAGYASVNRTDNIEADKTITLPAPEVVTFKITTVDASNGADYSTLVDGNNFEVSDGYIRSGAVSYHINNAHSKGYITFTTPSEIPDECKCVTVKGYVSSEGSSYDYGYVYIEPSAVPNYNSGNTYTAGTTNGRMMAQGGTSNSLTTFTSGVLQPDTTYTLSFGYRKDGSVDSGSDRFFIKEITFPEAG